MKNRHHFKFNHIKAVNNIYKPSRVLHKREWILHSMKGVDMKSKATIYSILLSENSLYEVADLMDLDKYERWLKNGGEY